MGHFSVLFVLRKRYQDHHILRLGTSETPSPRVLVYVYVHMCVRGRGAGGDFSFEYARAVRKASKIMGCALNPKTFKVRGSFESKLCFQTEYTARLRTPQTFLISNIYMHVCRVMEHFQIRWRNRLLFLNLSKDVPGRTPESNVL